jgi:hypothetical protein
MVQHNNDQVDAASCVFSNVDPGWWEALSSARIRPTTTPALAKFLIGVSFPDNTLAAAFARLR